MTTRPTAGIMITRDDADIAAWFNMMRGRNPSKWVAGMLAAWSIGEKLDAGTVVVKELSDRVQAEYDMEDTAEYTDDQVAPYGPAPEYDNINNNINAPEGEEAKLISGEETAEPRPRYSKEKEGKGILKFGSGSFTSGKSRLKSDLEEDSVDKPALSVGAASDPSVPLDPLLTPPLPTSPSQRSQPLSSTSSSQRDQFSQRSQSLTPPSQPLSTQWNHSLSSLNPFPSSQQSQAKPNQQSQAEPLSAQQDHALYPSSPQQSQAQPYRARLTSRGPRWQTSTYPYGWHIRGKGGEYILGSIINISISRVDLQAVIEDIRHTTQLAPFIKSLIRSSITEGTIQKLPDIEDLNEIMGKYRLVLACREAENASAAVSESVLADIGKAEIGSVQKGGGGESKGESLGGVDSAKTQGKDKKITRETQFRTEAAPTEGDKKDTKETRSGTEPAQSGASGAAPARGDKKDTRKTPFKTEVAQTGVSAEVLAGIRKGRGGTRETHSETGVPQAKASGAAPGKAGFAPGGRKTEAPPGGTQKQRQSSDNKEIGFARDGGVGLTSDGEKTEAVPSGRREEAPLGGTKKQSRGPDNKEIGFARDGGVGLTSDGEKTEAAPGGRREEASLGGTRKQRQGGRGSGDRDYGRRREGDGGVEVETERAEAPKLVSETETAPKQQRGASQTHIFVGAEHKEKGEAPKLKRVK